MNIAKFKGLEVDPSKISESTTVKPLILPEHNTLMSESSGDKPKILLPRIEAIHEGRTRNYNRYLAEKLKGNLEIKSGVYSWLHPYPKPVIYNHDIETEATGRVHNAAYTEFTKAGRKGIVVIPKISDPTAIQKILDGRLLTVSIGATTDSAVCSACGTDIITEGWCGHEKGEVIDGIAVEWIAGNLFFNELSWVNEPADQDAMVIDTGQISVAEAFAHNGNRQIIDLGKKRTEWVLTSTAALAEGLVPTKEEEGDNTVTNEELLAQVNQLTSDLQQVTTEKKDLEVELNSTKEGLQTAQHSLAEETAKLEAKTAESEELATAKTTAEAQVSDLTQQVESLESERTGLVETNTQLASEVHSALAERVVDLKVIMGKATREGALESHVARSTESLKDSLSDLLTESTSFTPTRVIEHVGNPAGGIAPGKEQGSLVEGKQKNSTGEPKELSTEEVLARLFGSRTNN